MSQWIDSEGRRHVGVMVGGQRLHRRLPAGATAGDAKRIEASLRESVARARPAVIIPGDPPLAQVMALYIRHAESLRSPGTAKDSANRIGPWVQQYTASQAREAAAHIVRDLRKAYAPATINRSLATLKKGLALAWECGLTATNHGPAVKSLAVNNKREMFLTIDQVRHLADCCPEPARAAVWIAQAQAPA